MFALSPGDAAEPVAALLDGGGPGFLIAWILWRLSRMASRAEAKLAEVCESHKKHHETVRTLLNELRAERVPAANGVAPRSVELEHMRRRIARLESTHDAGA